MKRILCLILALMLLIPAAYADVTELPTITVTLSANAVKVGDTVRVTASVKDAPTCASYHIIYAYDTAVLKPIEGKNLYTSGMFTTNLNPKQKGTISTVAADSNKVIAGDLPIFYTDFEVIAAPAEGTTTPLTFTKLEFYTPELEKLVNIKSEPCSIPIISTEKPADPEENTPADPTPTPDPTPDVDAPVVDTPVVDTPVVDTPIVDTPEVDAPVVDAPEVDTPSAEENTETVAPETVPALPEDSEGEDPTGNWEFNEEKQEVTLTDPEGGNKTYTYAPIIDPETNQQAGVIIYDENGKEAGKLKVEKDESGKLQVLKEFIDTASDPSPLFFILPIALAVLVGGGLIAFYVIKQKKAVASHEE